MNAAQREKRRLKKLRAKLRNLEPGEQPNGAVVGYDAARFPEILESTIAAAMKAEPRLENKQQALGYICTFFALHHSKYAE